jgi:DNA invertase Pin-like site-specific DNA recombinase
VFRLATRSSISRPPHAESFRRAVHRYLDDGDWQLVEEFVEAESGKRSDRPQLQKALKACRKTGFIVGFTVSRRK